MKTHPVSFPAAVVLTLALVLALASCSNLPTRQASLESSFTANAPASPGPGFELPVPRKTVDPVYPFEQRRAGVAGEVKINCRIDQDGKVSDLVLENATDQAFVPPAMAALEKWSFHPARRNGVPVSVRASIPIKFTLQD